MKQLTVTTSSRTQLIDITADISGLMKGEGIVSGLCHVFVPHTTAGITINENADPDVSADILRTLSGLVPERGPYRHREGNADAHLKASIVGASVTMIVEKGALALGVWQSVFLCEFDGPRRRTVFVKTIPG